MVKKGGWIKKSWFRRHWILTILIALIIMWIIGSFFNNSSDNVQTNTNSTETKQDTNEEVNETIETNNTQIAKIKDDFSNIGELHWTHMPLTYKFENECIERQINFTRLAFRTIENETNLLIRFKEVSEYPDISIYCKLEEWVKYADIKVAGAFYNTSASNKSLITLAEINFYSQGRVCGTGYPTVEVHEILHTFGFMDDSVNNRIMSRYLAESTIKCKITHIDEEPLSCLKYIYSNGEIQGNCSRVLFRVCENGYIVGLDNKCHKECDEGYVMYKDYKCYPDCEEGYVLGQDYECHEECGKGYYCIEGYACVGGKCQYNPCREGYVWGDDYECHEECDKGSYCLENYSCCNNSCLKCFDGSYLGDDCMCHVD